MASLDDLNAALRVIQPGGKTPAMVNAPQRIPIDRNKPPWLKVRLAQGPNYSELKGLVRDLKLHTVCEEAHCPNIGECWEHRTATFMILGDVCTRACSYCAVKTGRPDTIDEEEPVRIGQAVASLGLRHAVITSVNRDDAEDGGAHIFAGCVREIRLQAPGCRVELLIPDFMGNWDALAIVMAEKPEILNHNTETVPRLYPRVRHKARYERSLELLQRAKEMGRADGVLTKSGLMVGLGETWDELLQVMRDLRGVNCDILTLGQYLRPSLNHAPFDRYYTPEEFAQLKKIGLDMGFSHVESGPLVRSSYHAHEQTNAAVTHTTTSDNSSSR